MKKSLAIHLLAASALMGACTSGPELMPQTYVEMTSKTYDEVWTDIIEVFSVQNIPIETVEKDSGIIVASSQTTTADQMSALADCGTLALMRLAGGSIRYNVFLREVATERQVRVNSTMVGTFSDGRMRTPVTCVSRGILEQQILDTVTQ